MTSTTTKLRTAEISVVTIEHRCRKAKKKHYMGSGLTDAEALDSLIKKVIDEKSKHKVFDFASHYIIFDSERTIYADGTTLFSYAPFHINDNCIKREWTFDILKHSQAVAII